jgi:nitrate reductase NapD
VNISSIVVNALPERARDVRATLEVIQGVEVHAMSEEGKLVVTIETGADRDTLETIERINHLPGVLSASLVYHHEETDPEKEA